MPDIAKKLYSGYEYLILNRPVLVLSLVVALSLVAAIRIPETRIETSADTLVLEGDSALQYYRDVRWRYPEREFLLLSWTPHAGDLLREGNRQNLAALNAELLAIDGISEVLSLLDVPLLNSPPLPITELVGNIRTLNSASDIDTDLVRKELTESPLYGSLVANQQLDTAAVQLLLEPDLKYSELLRSRETLRDKARDVGLDSAEKSQLKQISAAYKDKEAEVSIAREQLVSAVREVLDKHRHSARMFLGGVPMITADMVEFVRRDLVVFGLAILVFFVLLLAIIFRSPRWVLLPLVNCLAVVGTMLGLLTWMGWNMTIVSANFLVLLLIITLSITMHLMVRYQELQAESPGLNRRELAGQTMRYMLTPCLFMALTTIVSFISLFYSGVRPIIDFGWSLAIGTVVSLIWSILLFPSLLMLLPKGKPLANAADPSASLTVHFAHLVKRCGNWLLVAGLIFAALSAWGISRLDVEVRFIDYFDKDTEIYRGMEVIDKELGGTMPMEVILTLPEQEKSSADGGFGDDFDSFGEDFGDSREALPWFDRAGLEQIEAVHDYLDDLPETGKVLSLATTWKLAKQLLGHSPGDLELALLGGSLPPDISSLLIDPYLNPERRETRISFRVKDTSRELRRHDFINKLKNDLHSSLELSPDHSEVTGLLVLYSRLLQSLYKSQIQTVGTVLFCILIMFLIMFRSLKVAVLALMPNILAAAVILGGMGLAGLPLDLMTVTIAAIVLGIGVDDTVHYVWRFKLEFAKDRNYMDAVYRSHGSIGRAMYYTSITVILGFAMLSLSNFRPSIHFGLLTSGAMLAALLGALLLLPQLLMRFRAFGPEDPKD